MCFPKLQRSAVVGCLVCLLVSILFAYQKPESPIHVTLSPQQWTLIPLPARAISLTNHGDEIWACGEHELIAVSSDGGSTWQVRHLAKSDKMLFTITFADDQTGYAWGSDGLALRSIDGGATWKEYSSSPGVILQAQFSDRANGLSTSAKWFATTHDGGITWRGNVAIDEATRRSVRVDIESAVEIDARHAAVLFFPADDKYGQLLKSTNNGGKNWKSIRFPVQLRLQTLTHTGNAYDAYGCKTTGKGADCQPIRLLSTDGLIWRTVLQAPPKLDTCVNQGCLDGSDRALVWEQDGEIQFPPRSLRVFDWAAAGHGICLVDDDLRCAFSRRLSVAEDALSHSAAPTWRADRESVCRSCPLPHYPIGEQNGQGPVTVTGWINEQGVPEDLTVRSAPTRRTAKIIVAAVRTWRFVPAELHHHAVREPLYLQLDFLSGRD